jgi:hypothetical protein
MMVYYFVLLKLLFLCQDKFYFYWIIPAHEAY